MSSGGLTIDCPGCWKATPGLTPGVVLPVSSAFHAGPRGATVSATSALPATLLVPLVTSARVSDAVLCYIGTALGAPPGSIPGSGGVVVVPPGRSVDTTGTENAPSVVLPTLSVGTPVSVSLKKSRVAKF